MCVGVYKPLFIQQSSTVGWMRIIAFTAGVKICVAGTNMKEDRQMGLTVFTAVGGQNCNQCPAGGKLITFAFIKDLDKRTNTVF